MMTMEQLSIITDARLCSSHLQYNIIIIVVSLLLLTIFFINKKNDLFAMQIVYIIIIIASVEITIHPPPYTQYYTIPTTRGLLEDFLTHPRGAMRNTIELYTVYC